MKKSKFTEEQVAFALKQADTGTKVPEICREMGISQATFYAWRKKMRRLRHRGVEASEATRTREPPSQAVGGRSQPGQRDAPGGNTKEALRPAQKREPAYFLVERYGVSTWRATRLVELTRSSFYYKPHPRDDRAERARILEIAEKRVRCSAVKGG
jgi:hypothetical protein